MAATDTGMGAFVVPRSAERDVANRQKSLNGRSVPPVIESVERLSKETQLYVFNVSPWAYTQYVGAGKFHIPACEPGKQYSEPVTVPGIFGNLTINDEKSMRRIDEDGMNVVNDILGVGPGLAPNNALTRHGVSFSRQWPPTKSEVAKAWEALRVGELNSLIEEANSADAQGETAAQQTIRGKHYEAARLLKKTVAECRWIQRASANTSNNVDCKFCGTPIKPNLAKCPNCHEIVDKELYAKLTA